MIFFLILEKNLKEEKEAVTLGVTSEELVDTDLCIHQIRKILQMSWVQNM